VPRTSVPQDPNSFRTSRASAAPGETASEIPGSLGLLVRDPQGILATSFSRTTVSLRGQVKRAAPRSLHVVLLVLTSCSASQHDLFSDPDFVACNVSGNMLDVSYFGFSTKSYSYRDRTTCAMSDSDRKGLYSLFLHLNDLCDRNISGEYSGGHSTVRIEIVFAHNGRSIVISVLPGVRDERPVELFSFLSRIVEFVGEGKPSRRELYEAFG
jgi:hypothetical protein